MSRIQLNLPEKVIFTTSYQLRITDMNYGNHLGNDVVLSIAHETRMQFFKSINAIELDFFGCGLIMSDAAIIYKAEGFYGDELKIELMIDDLNKYGFDLYYRAIRKSDSKILFEAKTGILCFDYSIKKLKLFPDTFKKLFE